MTTFDELGFVPHNFPSLSNEEVLATERVLQSNWIAPGPEVKAFEEEFSSFLGFTSNQAVAVSSGSAALYLALLVGEAADKNVATPVYACSALRNAIGLANAKPIYIDNQKDSALMNLNGETVIGSSICIAAHLFGFPLDLSRHSFPFVIEDVAQAIGATVAGKMLGTVGDCGVFSFYASKLMTSGGHGGMFVSKNPDVVEFVRDYINFDCRRDEKLRFNFQMTDLQAAVGRVQLARLPEFIQRRREIFEYYKSRGLALFDGNISAEGVPVYYRAILLVKEARRLQKLLEENRIKTIVPIEDWEIQSRDEALFPSAYEFSRKTLSLPIYPLLKKSQVKRIADLVLDSGLVG